MDNIFYQSQIEYLFVKKIDNVLNLQYDIYKKQIIKIILDELDELYELDENKLLKNKNK
jgi:hypothetical protein|tara:strand:+ start:472 stop:648 length:177 start_codon:yes stop_codon:yes gene_type:complete